MTPLMLALLLPLALARVTWLTEPFCDELRDRTRDLFDAAALLDATPLDADLWLGNVCAATNHVFLAQYNITHVVNVAQEWADHCDPALCGARDDCHVRRYCFALDDTTVADRTEVTRLLEAAAARVTALRETGHRVLVHCNMGVSRSTAVVLRHLMDREPTLLYSEALGRVRRLRPIATPNVLFELLLDSVPERKRRWKAKFEL